MSNAVTIERRFRGPSESVDRYEVDLLAEETRTNSGPLGPVGPLVHVQVHDRADLGAVTVDEFAAMPIVSVCHLGHLFSKAGIRE